jgi:NAD(P)-dependent dehydrogenase (short-subunit alcohol dehydrogenase family)
MSIAGLPDKDNSLRNTRALVTGGTSGIGFAMAAALQQAGARVAFTSRSAERARTAERSLPNAIGLVADARDEASVAAAVRTAWERLEGINLLVNNAGVGMISVNSDFMTAPQPFWNVSPDQFRAAIDTNLTGYFLAAREVVPRMLKAGSGRVVNISINHATMTRAGFVPYGPSRAGSEALSRVMAEDLRGSTVTVNTLLPGGATRTGMVPDGMAAGTVNLLEPEIMGPPIVWLASADAAGLHGEVVVAQHFQEWLRTRDGHGLTQ